MCAMYSFLISVHTIPTAVASFQGAHIFDNPVKIKKTPQTASLTIAFVLWVQLSTFFSSSDVLEKESAVHASVPKKLIINV